VAAELRRFRLAAAARDLKARALVGPLLREADRQGLRPAVSKGFHWAERLYGEPGLRPYLDVDLFVHPREWNALLALLRDAGFHPEEEIEPAPGPGRGAPAWSLSPVFRKDGLALEIHANPLGLHAPARGEARFWSSLRPVRLAGEPAWVPGWPHEMIYASIHAQQHSYARLSWLVDLAEMAALPDFDWDEAASIASDEGMEEVLSHGLRLVARCWEGAVPGPGGRLISSGGWARKACLFLWPPEAVAARRPISPAPYYMPSILALARRGKVGPALRAGARVLCPPRGWIRRQASGAGPWARAAYAAGRWLRPWIYLAGRLFGDR
jgi:hypothetical protein